MSLKHLLAAFAGAILLAAAPLAQAVDITHDLGTTSVPDAPKRIVVLEYSFIDSLAAVGVAPVGIADDDTRESVVPAYTDIIGNDWTSVGTRKSPSLEVIASLAPDLIIADTSRHKDIYAALSEIAPTIVFDSLTGTYETALAAAQTIANAVGKGPGDDGAPRRAHQEDGRLQGRDRRRFRLVRPVLHRQWRRHLPALAGQLQRFVLSWFGFQNNMKTPDGHSYEEAVVTTSLEQLSEVNPQILIRGKYAEPGLTDSWKGQPLWDNLEAVQKGNVYDVIAHNWSRLRGVIASEVSGANLVEIVKQLKK